MKNKLKLNLNYFKNTICEITRHHPKIQNIAIRIIFSNSMHIKVYL